MTALSASMRSVTVSLAARIASAFWRLSAVILCCTSATAASLISMKSEWLIGSRDGQPNRADARVEVNDRFVGGDKGANVGEGVAVDGQIYLEKALSGIAKCRVEQGVAQRDVAEAGESLGDAAGW